MRRRFTAPLCFLLSVILLLSCLLVSCQKDVQESVSSDTQTEQVSDEPESTTKEEEPTMEPYQHVVIIGVDGAGAYFQNASTPNIDRIFQNGAITYRMLTANPSISAQCWGSLLHGVTPEFHGLTNEVAKGTPYPTDSPFPSIFRVVRENDPDAILASFSHWYPINVGIIEDGLNVHKETASSDASLTNAICTYLTTEVPKLMFVQFDEADQSGHANEYNTAAQWSKLTEIDGLIGRIYDAYEAQGVLDETLFIVTADHGGLNKTHGGLSDTEKYVMLAAAGRTVESGGTIPNVEIRDLAAITAFSFGYDTPDTWTACVPSGLFEGITAKERPVYVNKDSARYHESVPTPQKNSADYVTNYIQGLNLTHYLTFDETIQDACGGTTTQTGKLYFVDGYFGKAVSLDDGYVSLKNYAPGTDSFTISFWIRTAGNNSDPAILSNKDWNKGTNPGFILALHRSSLLKFNMGDGTNRTYADATLPADFAEGWMHVILSVDRVNNRIGISCDFGQFVYTDIPETLRTDSLNAYDCLNIGQDGTGNYPSKLSATMDEVMIFDGAFNEFDVEALAQYYGKA